MENMENMEKRTLSEKMVIAVKWITGGMVLSFFLLFYYSPIITTIQNISMGTQNNLWNAIIQNLIKISNLEAIVFSIMQGIFTTLICMSIGLPLSYILRQYKFPGRKVLLYAFTLPFILPTSVILFGFNLTYNSQGWFFKLWTQIFSSTTPDVLFYGNFHIILIMHVASFLAIVLWIGGLAWDNINYNQVAMASSLGVSKVKIFQKIVYPQIKPFLASAAVLVFVYSLNSFGIVLSLGGVKLQTIEVRIFKEAIYNFDFQESGILAIFQMILNGLLIFLYLRFEKQGKNIIINEFNPLPQRKILTSKPSPKQIIIAIGIILFLIIMAIFTIGPLIFIIVESFIPNTVDGSIFGGYRQFFTLEESNIFLASPLTMLWNTLWLAGINMLLSTIISLGIVFLVTQKSQTKDSRLTRSVKSIAEFFYTLPLTRSTIIVAIGLFIQFRESEFFVHGHNSWILIVITQAIISIPIITRLILNVYSQISADYLDMGKILGASRVEIFLRVELPFVKRAIFQGLLFAFIISIGEFSSTIFIARENYATLSFGIFQLLNTSNLQLPASMSVIFIIFTCIALFAIEINRNSPFQKKKSN